MRFYERRDSTEPMGMKGRAASEGVECHSAKNQRDLGKLVRVSRMALKNLGLDILARIIHSHELSVDEKAATQNRQRKGLHT